MHFEIQKNIPLPPVSRGKKSKYDFALVMEPGDSVLVETLNVACAIAARLKNNGRTAATRKVEGGFRVWRTA